MLGVSEREACRALGQSRGGFRRPVKRAADEEQLKRIETTLKDIPSLHGYHDLRTRKTGDYILVDVHLEFPANMTVGEAHDISDEVDRRLHDLGNILEVTTHFDPV